MVMWLFSVVLGSFGLFCGDCRCLVLGHSKLFCDSVFLCSLGSSVVLTGGSRWLCGSFK